MSLIVICGVDASGKKTQVNRLYTSMLEIEAISPTPKKVTWFDFPHYDSVSGPYIRALLNNDVRLWMDDLHDQGRDAAVDLKAMKAVLLQALMSMNRYEYSKFIDEYYFSKDKILLLDRYFASALAYGPEDGLPEDVLIAVHSKLEVPDLSILIDLPAAESMQRRLVREDAYESDCEFLERVRQRYLTVFNDLGPRVYGETWVVVDGMGSEDDVAARILKVYKDWAGV